MVHTHKARFEIGTQYKKRGRAGLIGIVKDIHYTYNLIGKLVKIEYVTVHLFCGQWVTEKGVCDATIARGIVELEGGNFIYEAIERQKARLKESTNV